MFSAVMDSGRTSLAHGVVVRRIGARLIDAALAAAIGAAAGLCCLVYLRMGGAPVFSPDWLTDPGVARALGVTPTAALWMECERWVAVAAACALFANHAVVGRNGRTVGKRALGLRVTRADGRSADFMNAFVLRELPWLLIPFAPVLLLADLAVVIWTGDRSLRDLLSGTTVRDRASLG